MVVFSKRLYLFHGLWTRKGIDIMGMQGFRSPKIALLRDNGG